MTETIQRGSVDELGGDAPKLAGAVTYKALFKALDRCMKAHPTDGGDRSMHKDANAMAGLWAEMHLQNLEAVALETVSKKVLDAFYRWGEDGPGC